MLNYIWAGLIVSSLLFALVIDVGELIDDPYRGGQALPVEIAIPEGTNLAQRRIDVDVLIDPATYGRFYDTTVEPDSVYSGTLVQMEEGRELRFGGGGEVLPDPLATIQAFHADEEGDPLRGRVTEEGLRFDADSARARVDVTFEPVRFRKMRDIAQAALDFAETAAELALGLIGVLALFLGLLKIGEAAGFIEYLTRFVQPVLRPLFPEVPDGHPALAMISLNLLANVFGLGNAATPLGIKAMEELQELNPSDTTATNSMVMLLALNTSSVQLVPPVLLVAIMGLQINQLIFSIILATLCSTIAGALGARLLGRSRWYRKTDPIIGRDAPGEA